MGSTRPGGTGALTHNADGGGLAGGTSEGVPTVTTAARADTYLGFEGFDFRGNYLAHSVRVTVAAAFVPYGFT